MSYDPSQSVVRIVDEINGQFYQGSGVLISPDEVLTANHVSFAGGAVATNITVEPGYNYSGGILGSYTGTVTHYVDMAKDPGGGIALSDIERDYSIIHLSRPVIGGSIMRVSAGFLGGAAHVTGYPGTSNGAMLDVVQVLSVDPNYSILKGPALHPGNSGGPVWTTGVDGVAEVRGVVSASGADTSYDVQLTATKVAQINAWVQQDDTVTPPPPPPQPVTPVTPVTPLLPPVTPPPPQPLPPVTPEPHSVAVLVHDGSTGQDVPDTASHAYAGAVDYLHTEWISLTPHNLNVSAVVKDVFIHTGTGDDAVALLGGRNVVDGGTGSNYLTGGSGLDTFFVDARHAATDTWSTVAGFHSGDAATLWGISSSASLAWADNEGAVGGKGLTLHAKSANGAPTASLTLAGYSGADLAAGRLTAQFGADTNGSPYLYVRAA